MRKWGEKKAPAVGADQRAQRGPVVKDLETRKDVGGGADKRRPHDTAMAIIGNLR